MASLRMVSSQTAAPACAAPLRPNAPRPRTQPQIQARPSLSQQNQQQQQQRSHVCSSLPHDSPSLSPVSSTAPSTSTYTTTSAFLLGRNATTRSALRRTLKASRKRVDTTALGALLQCDPQLQAPTLPRPNNTDTCTSNSTSLEHELHLLTKMLKQLSQEASVTLTPPPRTLDQSPSPAATTSSSSMEVSSSSQTLSPVRPAPSRPVYNPIISCASLLPPTPLPEALQLQLPTSASGRLLVCQGSKCQAAGSMDTLRTASALVASSPGLEVLPSKCLGKCKQGPVMRVTRPEGEAAPGTDPKGQMYTHVIAQHLGQALHQEFCM